MTLSKSRIKLIKSLELKKTRKAEKLFIAEGHKSVGELLDVFPCKLLVATPEWLSAHPNVRAEECHEVTSEELQRVSLLKHPQEVLALFEQPTYSYNPSVVSTSLCLALDDVQDPGNLGTIIRIADWFGIEHIFCSLGTADVYNPKTVQATMGAIGRVKTHYVQLDELLSQVSNFPIYGTFLDGENIYDEELSAQGIIVMGNEGNGINPQIGQFVNKRLYIPSYPQERETSESLNVAIATAITCAEFRRRV